MRIVDVCEFYSPTGGGIRSYVDRKMQLLAEAGHELTVLAPSAEDREEVRATGGRMPWFALPRALWPVVIAVARGIDRVRPLGLTPPQALAMLGVELRFDARKAREELGWRPRPFEDVLQETVDRLLGRAPRAARTG